MLLKISNLARGCDSVVMSYLCSILSIVKVNERKGKRGGRETLMRVFCLLLLAAFILEAKLQSPSMFMVPSSNLCLKCCLTIFQE